MRNLVKNVLSTLEFRKAPFTYHLFFCQAIIMVTMTLTFMSLIRGDTVKGDMAEWFGNFHRGKI